MSDRMDLAISAENLHKAYKNGVKDVHAVNGVTIEIRRGQTTAIVGPSGAGKSTILHLLGGLDKPTSGKVMLGGVDIYKLSDRQRALIRNKTMGFVFQFYHLLPEFTALENVMMPGLIKGQGVSLGFARDKRGRVQGLKGKAIDVLKSVGLEDRISHRPGELSGGESQRVAVARAIINDPEILLCDEPTGNLDSKASEAIYDLLLSLKSKSNMALVIVTHDDAISKKSDHIIRIKDGKPA